MADVNPSMRLKVKRDTFFLPDPNGSVYFRNNVGSFRMEGRTIHQWVEKLMPMFNGEHTMEDLTDGLPDQYRERIYKIAEKLYQNGFVRDVSQDRPHQLTDQELKKYAPQIEFLDNLSDSAAYRFQSYRQAKVLAVGSGPFFVSLVSALLESGLAKFHMLVTNSVPTNRERLAELAAHALQTDTEVALQEITLEKEGIGYLREAVKPFDAILYVSQHGDVEELRALHAVCKEEGKVLLPAIFLQQAGLAGPLVHPDIEGCWESAWRRVHRSALQKNPQFHTVSTTAGAILANVIVFELFKTVTGVSQSEIKNRFFLLNLETLEGSWHSFMPHPLVTGKNAAELVIDLDELLANNTDSSESNSLLPYFSKLTSRESGILHIWDEGDLKQLPLAQCRVQAADPLSTGPAELLPEIICTGLTHEETRREAGLIGIESYVSRLAPMFPSLLGSKGDDQGFIGVGAGATIAEGICRGLQKCLAEELGKQQRSKKPSVIRVKLSTIEDNRCQFYLQALTTMQGAPVIGLGAEVSGFPVLWVGTNERWYGSVGLHLTMALRSALQQALLEAQNQAAFYTTQAMPTSSIMLEETKQQRLVIPSFKKTAQKENLQSALQILKQNQKQLLVFDLALEPFLKEELAGVFGVVLQEEGSR